MVINKKIKMFQMVFIFIYNVNCIIVIFCLFFIILFISHFVKIDNFSSYENEYIKKTIPCS